MARTEYSLERREPNPHHGRRERTCNMTNLPYRWKEIAVASSIEDLVPYLSSGYRICDRTTLAVIGEG